jgi:catechol 2,3-dioxygenase-like lactoylglutathione lyase family enzyme
VHDLSSDSPPDSIPSAIADTLPGVLHHVVLEVADLDRSASFYDALLAPLGWRRHSDGDDIVGWGIAKPVFYVSAGDSPQPNFGLVSFSALGIAAVKAAWQAGVESGGRSAAEPGERRGHGSGSYSAFLIDPDGYQVEITVSAD